MKPQIFEHTDQALVRITERIDFLRYLTPVNTDEAWAEFSHSRFMKKPRFSYVPENKELHHLKKELQHLQIPEGRESGLKELLVEKREELTHKINLLIAREKSGFLEMSKGLFPGPEDTLTQLARTIIEHTSPAEKGSAKELRYQATDFVKAAKEEVAYYQKINRRVSAVVELRDDLAGLMVSRNHLLVGKDTATNQRDLIASIHHEVGTHLVTHWNGQFQPLYLLSVGLAGYEELQEGLAVLMEFFADALSVKRLKLLAMRVLSVQHLVQGASFADIYNLLCHSYGLDSRSAYLTTVRVFRGGGLTKDVIYLRGFVALIGYLKKGGRLDLVFAGKMAFRHIPTVAFLMEKGILVKPVLTPRLLTDSAFQWRLNALRSASSILELANA